MVVLRMNGEKVRTFNNSTEAKVWAKKHCHGNISIVYLTECSGLPKASSRIYPNEDIGKLTYRPFVALT